MIVRWNRPASDSFRKSIRYIAEDSITASIAVRKRVDKKVRALKLNPTRYPPDSQKRNNDGTFRAFTSDSLRISYRVFRQSIHIIRVRHAARKPLQY